MPDINGLKVAEIRCKNDDCRALLGYEKVKIGLLVFVCRKCETTSVFKMGYSKGQENIDMIKDDMEGGEIE